MASSLYDAPVVCHYESRKCEYAPSVPQAANSPPAEVHHRAPGSVSTHAAGATAAGATAAGANSVGATAATGATCGFRRFAGVDNAAAGRLKPSYGYGISRVVHDASGRSVPSLDACEQACCAAAMCHSVVWHEASKTCDALLAIAHGARRDDFCWHPTLTAGAITSIRLPGQWLDAAVAAAASVLRATTLVRRGGGAGARTYRKTNHWTTPAGHAHPLERSIEAISCDARATSSVGRGAMRGGAVEVSEMLLGAIPLGDPRPGKPKPRPLSCPA